MHSSTSKHGGDLKTDTVTIIGGALDLQEKVVKQAMTPIEDVFMLSLDARLDWETLRRICATGHSRVPVFEEVEVPESALLAQVSTSWMVSYDWCSLCYVRCRVWKWKELNGLIVVIEAARPCHPHPA